MNDGGVWYLGIHGQQQGPLGTQQILELIRAGHVSQVAYVYGQLAPSWTPIAQIAVFAAGFQQALPPPPPPPPVQPATAVADQIEFEVFGGEAQYVEIILDPGEAAIADAGALFYMDPGIRVETIFGGGAPASHSQEFVNNVAASPGGVLAGESLSVTVFGNGAQQRQRVAFAAPYASKIAPMDLRQYAGQLLCQRDAFLCAAKGISVGIAWQQQHGGTAFGPRGFTLQKLEGQGLAFVHGGGALVPKELAPGEVLRVEAGCLVALEPRVHYDIQYTGGTQGASYGEGHTLATLTGPGRIWLQSLSLSRSAARLLAAVKEAGFAQL